MARSIFNIIYINAFYLFLNPRDCDLYGFENFVYNCVLMFYFYSMMVLDWRRRGTADGFSSVNFVLPMLM
ncbi:unnamed protein product [Strongylus vulgaris]|uniref:Uncharacterized protein n=1 Tax=Strongylus vulgaris TaxID=40348 RepID=A0A3P7IYE9_STRVU|nr:unnamed protein product [Strongylus vulgaris]